MSATIELLDVSALRQQLEVFRSQVVSAEDASRIEAPAELLLRHLLEAPGRPVDESAPAAALGGGWIATRAVDPDGTRSLTCWNEEQGSAATLLAEWKGPALSSWSVTAADRTYGSQPADAASVTAKQNALQTLGARARAEFREWLVSHPRRRTYCAMCSFENAEMASVCAMCGSAIMPSSAEIGERPGQGDGRNTWSARLRGDELDQTQDVAPDDSPAADRRVLPTQVVAPPALPAASQNRVRPLGARPCDVVLRSFPPQRRDALLALLRDVLRDSGREEKTAEELSESLPAIVEARVSIVRAKELSDKLRALEATVDIRWTDP